jgi:hypothetical protein
MPENEPDRRELGFYFALSQVGLEMVAPMCLGLWLDYKFDWMPWATVIGAVLGAVGGFTHMLVLLKQHEQQNSSRQRGDQK